MRKLTGSIALILMIFLPLGQGLAEPDLNAQNIQATVEWLTEEIGIREAGTPMERAACDGLAKQLREMGFSEADGTLERSAFEGLKGVQTARRCMDRPWAGCSAMARAIMCAFTRPDWKRSTFALPESYHQMTDTAEDLDYDTALMTGRCLLAAVKSMADAWTSEVNLQ